MRSGTRHRKLQAADPCRPTGVTKLSCEHLAAAYVASFGLDVVCLRFFSVYGPRQRPDMLVAQVISALLEDHPFTLYGTGEQSRDFTYVTDAVGAAVSAMEHAPAGSVYNVGGGEEASVLTVVEHCEGVVGRSLDVRLTPEAEGDPGRTAADTSLIRTALEWSPATGLAQGRGAGPLGRG